MPQKIQSFWVNTIKLFLKLKFSVDFGYMKVTKANCKKTTGEKSHFFSKFVKNFNSDDGSESTLNITIQDVSNDKYLKLYAKLIQI